MKTGLILPLGLALSVSAAGFAQQQDTTTPPATPPAAGQHGPMMHRGMAPGQQGQQGPMAMHHEEWSQHEEGGHGEMEHHHFMMVRHEGGPEGMHGEMSMHHMDFWKSPMMVQKLGLTPDQVKKLDGIKEAGEIEAIHLRAAVEEQGVKMHSMMESSTFDQKAADMEIDRMADAKAALEKSEAKVRVSERAVLTPDQWTKMHTPEEHHMMQPGNWHGPKPGMAGQGPA